MSQITVKNFADQINVGIDRLLRQLEEAGVEKQEQDILTEEEKQTLLSHLRSGARGKAPPQDSSRNRITLKRKQAGEIRQTSRTGTARTIPVEVKKKRTFVRREVLEEQERQRQEELARQAEEERKAREAAEQEAQARAEAEQAEKERIEREEAERVEREEAERRASEEAQRDATNAADSAKEKEQVGAAQEASKAARKDKKPAVRPESEAKRADGQETEGKPRKKGKGEKGKRDELHVAKGHRGRRKREPVRPRKVQATSQHGFERPTAPVIREVTIPETISVGDLAQAMSVKAPELIGVLMNMGVMVTINQVLDQETATLVVEEMGHKAVAAAQENPEAALLQEQEEVEGVETTSRPPVVTVMGHVDHGKTSLLDYIRKAKVAAGEAGGITQHIGAYQVETANGLITFLDTPGHAAFTAMRARGAEATDLVILVVAADDGVKPQTIEAIRHAKDAGVPLVVAINKMDKEEADPERVKQELSNHEVIPEAWGGDTLIVPVSAISGDGVDTLLENVALQSELMELKARADGPASGLVVEARLDRGRGPVATVLVQQGVLRQGDVLLAGRETGRVRVMNNDAGESIKEAGPSTPVEIQGLSGVPVAGDEVLVVQDERRAKDIAEYRQSKHKEVKLARQQASKLENMFQEMDESEQKSLNLLVKADVQGSVEALTDSLENLSGDEVKVKVVHGMVGGINESDVNLAIASNAIIVGFNVRADAAARKLIESENVDVHYYNVIYDVVDEVKAAITGMLAPQIKEEILGQVEVRDVFRAPKIGAIAGCYVTEGVVQRNAKVRVLRENVVIFDGAVDSLRRFKDDVNEVKAGFECGIGVKNYNDVKVGDQLEIYRQVEVKPTL
ncbi:MAG: translation initiation factor IF-2 [Gammaproteobacteria bacterium]|nr:translation initiation factor IF-2 [Gammaproteobacteria bacterium]